MQEAWNDQLDHNDPDRLLRGLSGITRKFNPTNPTGGELPLAGEVPPESKPWTDSYYPNDLGSLAFRWNKPNVRDAEGRETIPMSLTYRPPSSREALKGTTIKPTDLVSLKYTPPTLEQLRSMSQAEIAELSPAEKYDIVMGNIESRTQNGVIVAQSYPLVKWELERIGAEQLSHLRTLAGQRPTFDASGNHSGFTWRDDQDKFTNAKPEALIIPHWAGICNGWAYASTHYKEPKPVIIEGANGIKVPFGSSDTKALLSLYYGRVLTYRKDPRWLGNFKRIGQRCELASNAAQFGQTRSCKDVNAGSFHLVMANLIGVRKQAFIGDLDKTKEVWNYPIFGFESIVRDTGWKRSYPAESKRSDGQPRAAAPGTDRIYEIETRLKVRIETSQAWRDAGRAKPADFAVATYKDTQDPNNATKSYRYFIEVDAQKNIIGGEWISENFPDAFWERPVVELDGYFAKLKDIYESSVAPHAEPDNFQKFPE